MATNFITVFPTKASALNIPADGQHPRLTAEGVQWPKDNWTNRRLSDGSITIDEAKAFKPAATVTAASTSTTAS